MKAVGIVALTKDMQKLFVDKIVVKNEDGSKTTYPNLLHCYDNILGFSDFFDERVKALMSFGVKSENILKNLRNFGAVSNGEGGKRHMPGWFEWRDANPSVCNPAHIEAVAAAIAQDEAGEEASDDILATLPPQ